MKSDFLETLTNETAPRWRTDWLTFDPEVASPAPEATARGGSLTKIGDLESAAVLDMGDSILQL